MIPYIGMLEHTSLRSMASGLMPAPSLPNQTASFVYVVQSAS